MKFYGLSNDEQDGDKMNSRDMGVCGRRYAWLLLACMALLGKVAKAQDQTALLDKVHRVIAQTSLNAADTKPWHLKLTVQLNAADGVAAEKGTVEEWWTAPKQYRKGYDFPSYKGTVVVNGTERYSSDGLGSQPYLADYSLEQVVHPMPSLGEVDAAHLELRKETFAKNDFDCIMLDPMIKNITRTPFGLFPTYCFDRDKDVLRISSEIPSQTVVMNRKGTFRGINVALDFGVSSAGKELASAHVEALQGRDTPYAESHETTGLKAVGVETARIQGGVIAGNILNKVPPIYPVEAKHRGASGTVLMHAIIGKEGHVHFLRPLTFPDPDLVIAAIAAVRQWTYRPYLLNGEPTEVDTTITVNFNLGPG